MVGSTLAVYSRQNGHWRSANSVMVTDARGLPSTTPCCGIPLNSVGPATFFSCAFVTSTAITTIAAAVTAAAPSCHRRCLLDVISTPKGSRWAGRLPSAERECVAADPAVEAERQGVRLHARQ